MKRRVSLLVVHGHVLTMEGNGVGYKQDGAIAVVGSKIEDVGASERLLATYEADCVIDATNEVVLPGLIDTHTHSRESLLRGVAQDVPEYMASALAPFSRAYTDESALAGTRLHVLEALKAGTTTIVDFEAPKNAWAQFYAQVGVRARLTPLINSLAKNTMAESGTDLYTFDEENGDQTIGDALAFAEQWHQKENGRITVMLGPQAPDMVTQEQLLRVKTLASKANLMIHMHVAQGDRESNQVVKRYGKRTIPYLKSIGYLDDQLFGVHLTDATNEEVGMMVREGSSMGLCSACIGLVDGIVPPAREYHDLGGMVGLGTDSASSNNCITLFNEMKLTALFNKIVTQRPDVMPAWTVLRMATIEGAQAIGLGDTIGSLEIGKEADMAIIDLSQLNLSPVVTRPIRNIVPNLVYSATGHEVDTVIIAGRIVMKGREILTANETSIHCEAQEAADDLSRSVSQDPQHKNLALLKAMDKGFL